MKYSLTLFLSILSCGLLLSQKFHTTFYLSNNQGLLDSVTIGFDPAAADGIDPSLGEVDLSNIPMQNFELRAGQVYNERMTYFEDLEHPILDSLAQYMGKTEIIPKECLSFIPVSNQAGFLASINLFIKTDSYPLIVKWDKEAFANACLSMSFITDWPITTWWDIPCCNSLEVGKAILIDKDSITLNSHYGINLTDGQGDTITMLTILLSDEIGTATQEFETAKDPKIFPNPSNGSFSISDDWQLVNISNAMGSRIDYSTDSAIGHTNYNGIMFITLEKEGRRKVLKQINNVR